MLFRFEPQKISPPERGDTFLLKKPRSPDAGAAKGFEGKLVFRARLTKPERFVKVSDFEDKLKFGHRLRAVLADENRRKIKNRHGCSFAGGHHKAIVTNKTNKSKAGSNPKI